MITATTNAQAAALPVEAPTSRRQLWVLPKLQGRLIGWLVAISAVSATSVTWIVLLLLWPSLTAQLVFTNMSADADALFWDACMRVLLTTGGLILAFGFVAFITGLVISHRIAGPLHRLGQVAEAVTRGVYHHAMEIRQSDYLHEFSHKFSRMVSHFGERSRHHERSLSCIYNKVDEVAQASAAGRMSGSEVANELRTVLEAIQEYDRKDAAGQEDGL